MPDTDITKTGETDKSGFDDVTKNNAEVAAKLAAQDISGKSTAAEASSDSNAALDALATAHDEEAKKKSEEVEVKEKETPPAKTEAELKAESDAKAAADAAEAERKHAEELFKDSPGLPPGASPKSSESFTAIKVRAAKEIAARESELEKLRKENAELAEKTKNAVPPETLKELEDHRKWRAQLDLEADPKFKTFDKTVSETHEFIYAQLRKSPVITDEVIDAIKKHGGPENVKMEKIFEGIKDPTLQRLVESKIADIEMVKFNKQQALSEAKKNVTEYLSEREKTATANASKHNADTEKHFSELTGKLDWYKEKPVDPKATEAERKATEAHNKMVTETRANLAVALKDDSPEMRAIMLTGMAQLFYLQRVHDGSVSAHKTEVDALKKSLDEVTEKYDKLRKGSTTRLRESVELTGGKPPTQSKPEDQFHMTATESLDNLRKQVTEERERAAAAGTK